MDGQLIANRIKPKSIQTLSQLEQDHRKKISLSFGLHVQLREIGQNLQLKEKHSEKSLRRSGIKAVCNGEISQYYKGQNSNKKLD